jgi:two-component system sensor histidine kinase GlrK
MLELLRVYRPKSFLKLILIGFACVALPLIFSLIHSAVSVRRLADQSQQAVYQAVRATQGSQWLLEQITAMERNARQFQVLRDESLFQVYAETHEEFRHTVGQLSELPLDTFQRSRLNKLAERERLLFHTLHGAPREPAVTERVVAEFAALSELAHAILAGSNRMVDHEVERMERMAAKAQQNLLWQAFAIIPGTVLFAGLFVILIARPVRQLDAAIHRLGDGQFSSEIAVTGPRDLEYLGRRLEWLRRRLMELEEDKRKFLRHVSHELKTPLTAIREGAELLSERVVGPLNPEQEEISAILRQNSIHLQKLIEDLLNFSVAHLRNSSLDSRAVRLNELIEGVISDHKTGMRAKQLRCEVELPPLTITGDREKLRIVVDNLLSNAVKFSHQGGRIKVSLRQDGEFARIDVVDTGPGIAAGEKARVFDAFYQGSAAQEGHVKGTGIGLSIAKEYVAAHHGDIEIVDDTPGSGDETPGNTASRGAHFRVRLPLQAVPYTV